MEILLAIVAASAVIFFGALISMGNERQRKAIDGLREQVVLWAVQDLKIKREHLAQMVQVPDSVVWLNRAASRVYGYDLKLQVLEIFDDPQSLICASGDGNAKVVFSPQSLTTLRRIKSSRQNRLSKYVGHNPLLHLPKGVSVQELSILNAGQLFDLELPLAWKALTGQNLDSVNSLWMYMVL